MIIVEGKLQNADYTDNNGVKHYAMNVQADNVTFGESKTAQNAAQSDYNSQPLSNIWYHLLLKRYVPITENRLEVAKVVEVNSRR